MNARWIAIDRDGYLGVFDSDVRVPEAVDEPEAGHELTSDLIRVLRLDRLPRRGRHATVRAGSLLMIADEERVRLEKAIVEPVTRDVIAVRFPPARRGKLAGFMEGVRSFGLGDDPSAIELLHQEGACEGCSTDGANDKPDHDGLQLHGLYVYEAHEDPDLLVRVRYPAMPLHAARIGELATRCVRYAGSFGEDDEIERNDFT
jgi:hypothetical protein